MRWLRRRASHRSSKQEPVLTIADVDERIRLLMALTNENSQPNITHLTVATRNLDAVALNIKANGYLLARSLADALPVRDGTSARVVGLESKLSTQNDIESDWLAHWCAELKIPVLYHRKLWEHAYLLQALHDAGHLQPGRRGLGFGCGVEPIPSYLAAHDVHVTMTDLPPDDARAQEWSRTDQFASVLENAWDSKLVARDRFFANTTHRSVDMNDIPSDLVDYDFCWSICALEHLGSIEKGLAFIARALDTLRPGGLAVHTTEFNINPNGGTIDNWPSVFFQRAHMEGLADALRSRGHKVAPFNFDPGSQPMDQFIDLPPWQDGVNEQLSRWLGQPHHLKVAADGFVVTCIGLIIER